MVSEDHERVLLPSIESHPGTADVQLGFASIGEAEPVAPIDRNPQPPQQIAGSTVYVEPVSTSASTASKRSRVGPATSS